MAGQPQPAPSAAPMASAPPPSPLEDFVRTMRDQPELRTGYTRPLRRNPDTDRHPAHAFRLRCRNGTFTGPSSGCAPGFVQANLVVLPQTHALDFLRFALLNPRACPLLDVTQPGDPHPMLACAQADVRTDLPKYRVWRDGEMTEEVDSIAHLWDEHMVAFVIGCSFTTEKALQHAGLCPRQIEEGCNVPMFETNIPNVRAGGFGGNLVVSMRPYAPARIPEVAAITGQYPAAHGAPIHWGDPEALGISTAALGRPDWGDGVSIREGEIHVFWACGVTPQAALREAKLPLAITHAPGHMLVTDLVDDELACVGLT